jgi:hypothetical protein
MLLPADIQESGHGEVNKRSFTYLFSKCAKEVGVRTDF